MNWFGIRRLLSIKSSPFVCQKNPNVKFYYKVLSYLLQAVIVIPVNYFIGEIDEPFIPVPAQGTDCVLSEHFYFC